MANATYFYKRWVPSHFDNALRYFAARYTKHQVRVDVLETKGARSYIKLCAYHEDGRPPGTTMWVQSGNIVTDARLEEDKQDIAKALGREVRKPYKDD